MKRMLALLFLLLLLLAGCSGTPQSRETGSTTVVSVLGAEGERGHCALFAAAQGREDGPPALLRGTGDTPAAGMETLRQSGERAADCAHVEHLLLAAEGAALLPDLLSYAFQEPQLGTETQLWVTAGELNTVFAPEKDPAKRMEVLKGQGKDRQGFAPVTLREAAAALAEGESLLLPYLIEGEDGLSFGGFVLWRDGGLAGSFSGPAARGAALLTGQRVRWVSGNLSLQSRSLLLSPVMEGKTLAGLTVSCSLDGVVTGGWKADEGELRRLERKTEEEIRQAWRRMRTLGGDGVGLKRRFGAGDPLRWGAVSAQWERAFSTLEPEISVHITVAERY